MSKAQLVEEVVSQTGLTKRASGEAIGAVIDGITDALVRGERVTLVGFGTFRMVTRKARTGRNPQTGGAIQIPTKKVPKFVAGTALKAEVVGKGGDIRVT